MRLQHIVIGLLALLFFQCKSQKTGVNYKLNSTRWTLVELNKKPLLNKDLRAPYIIFNEEEHKIGGYASCNNFTGNYKLSENDGIEFFTFTMTYAQCSDMSVEKAFMSVFNKTESYTIAESTMVFMDANSEIIATFSPIDDN